uniref:Uncharacterized protein n=1 Tax=Solanum tuberosum TaxID=4113 RepID=M1DQ78_SOLTU
MLRRAIRRSKLGSSIHSAMLPLVNSIAFLPWSSASFRAWHTGTLGGQMATRRLAKMDLAITMLSFLPSFRSLRSFLQISAPALFLNPNTWRSRILHQLLAQNKHLRTLNHYKQSTKGVQISDSSTTPTLNFCLSSK